MPTIGVAIPCYHGHITILTTLLDNIEKQSRKPDMVVVSCSGVQSMPQQKYSYPLKIVMTPDKLNTAQNRNIAASMLDTDIISFMDADDQMHFQRLEIIEKAFENDIVIFLHNYTDGFDKPDIKYDNIVFDINRKKSIKLKKYLEKKYNNNFYHFTGSVDSERDVKKLLNLIRLIGNIKIETIGDFNYFESLYSPYYSSKEY